MNSKLIPTGCFTASVLSLIISISKYISSGNSELLVGGVILTILLAIVGLKVLLKDRPSLFKGILALSLMILCGGIGVFIGICVYESGDADIKAVYIGIGFGLFCTAVGICMLLMFKNRYRTFYSPSYPLTEYTAEKVREAYAFHRGENDPKQLIERELAPNALTVGKTAHLDRLTALIDKCGCSRDEFNADYYKGEIFRGDMCMLNVGDIFTIYCDIGANQFVFRNSDIVYVGPYIETDEVSGMTVQRFNIKLRIKGEEVYHVLRIAQYMDRPVLDAFRKRRELLDSECEIFDYPY